MRLKSSGFTLIELMVTVAVIGILAAIAYPSYTSSIIKSRRTDAKAKLLDLAQRQERFYSDRNTYTATLADDFGADALTSDNGYYTLSAAATTGAGNTIANSFTLTATPTGSQANDTICGNLTLTNTNVKDFSGTGTVAECW